MDGARSGEPSPEESPHDTATRTIIECGERLALVVSRGRDDFLADPLLQDAACYLLIRVAEATKDLPAELKDAHPEIPWQAVTGLRNRLAHQYVGVNTVTLWDIAEQDVPRLVDAVREQDHPAPAS